MSLPVQLATLEAGGLIRLAQLDPELEYLFRHALIQETAYDTLVRADRRMLHQAAGESLERLFPARLASPDLAPMLAYHFGEAGDQPRALHYYALAGRAAAEVFANAEAVAHFGRALEIAQTLPADSEAVVDLFLRRGHTLELNAQDAEALANYEAMEAWAATANDARARLAAINARATIYVKPSVEQNLPAGYDLSQQALALARELGDRPAEAKVLWNLLQYYWAVGKPNEAHKYGERSLDIAREQGLREQIGYVLTDLYKAYYQAGQAERAVAALDEARSIWRELGVLNMLADNLASTSMTHIHAGEYDQAMALSSEAMEISRAIGNLWNQSYAIYMVDLVHFDRGDIGRAIDVAQECRRLAEQAGFAQGIYQMNFDLALVYGYMNDLSRAWEAARRLQARAEAEGPLTHALLAHLYLLDDRLDAAQVELEQIQLSDAELRQSYPLTYLFIGEAKAEAGLAMGSYERASTLAGEISAYFRQAGLRLFLADILRLEGRALRAAGRDEEAYSALEAARADAESLGSRRILWLILAELAALEAGRGNETAALALSRQAAEVVDYIAAHTGSDELRESFLQREDVREVLGRSGGVGAMPNP